MVFFSLIGNDQQFFAMAVACRDIVPITAMSYTNALDDKIVAS